MQSARTLADGVVQPDNGTYIRGFGCKDAKSQGLNVGQRSDENSIAVLSPDRVAVP